MAEVFVARARSVAGFEKVVALKTIHPRFSEDPEFARLLVEEANITAQLSHRNIVQVIDLGQIDDMHYIAMEYVDGMDLSRLISKMRERSQRCSPRFAAFIVREVCDGLEHAHRKSGSDGKPLKIIHRDVSPPNILISSAGEVKLTDFGIAKAALRASSTEAGVVKGKYAYMPPEQAKGQPLDVRADVFSAGCVLYELATGAPVYKDGPLPVLLDRVSRGIYDAPEKVRPDLPAPLVAVIKKALAPAAQDRYASARAMADDLNAFLYTLPPNPEFEVSQIVSGIQEGSRSSIPPMAGMSLFDDDSEESTQIESMAAMRSKMVPGEAGAKPAAKPTASVAMQTAPDPDAFTDEPTRAMRREKLIPDAAPEDDDEPEPTAVGVRPNTAAPRVMGSNASIPAVRPAAGAAAAPKPAPSATSSSKPVTAAMPTAGPRPQAQATTAKAPAAPASPEPRLPARKATLIGAVAPVLPERAPPSPPPAPAQRRSMPPPPPPAATKSTMNMPA
ncbi:MAG: serine/threonine protein kinase, partial [Polyangiales bacterium]